ncbi:MAG: hypothetical protein AB7G06_03725 [Bdellovibrionales bacterium]
MSKPLPPYSSGHSASGGGAHIDMTPHRLDPVNAYEVGEQDFIIDEKTGEFVGLKTTGLVNPVEKIPATYCYSPAQTEALLLEADEISFNVTHLHIGWPTVERYGHVGGVLKKNGKVLAYLDGYPAECIPQEDGSMQWVPVGQGLKQHTIKMFCTTPESQRARFLASQDHKIYEDIGSISLKHAPMERRREVAAEIRQAMEKINAANIPYIVPSSVVARELTYMMLGKTAARGLMGKGARMAVRMVAKVKTLDGLTPDFIVDTVEKTRALSAALIGRAFSPNNIQPEPIVGTVGGNSLDIAMCIAEKLGRRRRPDLTKPPGEDNPIGLEDILENFLAKENHPDNLRAKGVGLFRLPGGKSDLLNLTIHCHTPEVWEPTYAEARARAKAAHDARVRAATGTFGKIAATIGAVALLPVEARAHAAQLLQAKAAMGPDSVTAIISSSSKAAAQGFETAVQAVTDPGAAMEAASQAARNPLGALDSVIEAATGLTATGLLLYFTMRPDKVPANRNSDDEPNVA